MVSTCQGGNPCGTLFWHDESTFIHPLMALLLCLPVIFLSFVSIAGKLQEKLASVRVSFVQCCMSGAPGAVRNTD